MKRYYKELIRKIVSEEVAKTVGPTDMNGRNENTESVKNAFADSQYVDVEQLPNGKMIVGIT